MVISPIMGVATSVNIQISGNKGAAAGDFVLTSSEVNPVIQALTKSGITVTAFHNHMLSESPPPSVLSALLGIRKSGSSRSYDKKRN